MVVGMDRVLRSEFAAQQSDRTVGDDFVHVHVELCSRAGLPDYEREMVVQFAVCYFLGRGLNRLGDFLVEAILSSTLTSRETTSALTIAAACLRIPPARINGSGILSVRPGPGNGDRGITAPVRAHRCESSGDFVVSVLRSICLRGHSILQTCLSRL